MTAHRAYAIFIPYTLYVFSKFSSLSTQYFKTSQVWRTTAQVLTLDRKALPDLTQPQPSLARSPGTLLSLVCHPGLHQASSSAPWPSQFPLPRKLLRNAHGSGPPFLQASTQKTCALPGFLTPTPYPLLSTPLEPVALGATLPWPLTRLSLAVPGRKWLLINVCWTIKWMTMQKIILKLKLSMEKVTHELLSYQISSSCFREVGTKDWFCVP